MGVRNQVCIVCMHALGCARARARACVCVCVFVFDYLHLRHTRDATLVVQLAKVAPQLFADVSMAAKHGMKQRSTLEATAKKSEIADDGGWAEHDATAKDYAKVDRVATHATHTCYTYMLHMLPATHATHTCSIYIYAHTHTLHTTSRHYLISSIGRLRPVVPGARRSNIHNSMN
jgi:hypothetical protein